MRIKFIPQTIKATKRMRKTLKKSMQSFLKSSTRRMKKISKSINNKTAMKISSLMKKRHRK